MWNDLVELGSAQYEGRRPKKLSQAFLSAASDKEVREMTAQQTSISDKIARAEAALKSGLLDNYAPVSSANSAETKKSTTSWGSAMRR